jgi:PEP-CTERM motif
MSSGFFELDFINNNPASIGPTNVSFSLNNTFASTTFLPAIPSGQNLQTIAFNVSPNNAISNNLSLTFNGGLGYDVVVNSITFVSSVPEPSEWAMLVAGIALVGHMARRRKKL